MNAARVDVSSAPVLPVRFLSPRDLAKATGASESSFKRWIDAGQLAVVRTHGGHRRVALAEAARFVRTMGLDVRDPVLFGLRTLAVPTHQDFSDVLFQALVAGDVVTATDVLVGRWLGGEPLAAICDGPLCTVLRRVGELWQHDDAGLSAEGIAIERLVTGQIQQIVHHIRSLVPVRDRAPVALGAAPSGDPYILPGLMVSAVLADQGLRTIDLGPETPLPALVRACVTHRPRLIWLSVSTKQAARHVLAELAALLEVVTDRDGWLVMGGRCVPKALPRHARIRLLEDFSRLAELGAGLLGPGSSTTPWVIRSWRPKPATE